MIFRISCIAAPVADVTTPMVSGNWGIGFLYCSSKSPSSESLRLSSSNLICNSPIPEGIIRVIFN